MYVITDTVYGLFVTSYILKEKEKEKEKERKTAQVHGSTKVYGVSTFLSSGGTREDQVAGMYITNRSDHPRKPCDGEHPKYVHPCGWFIIPRSSWIIVQGPEGTRKISVCRDVGVSIYACKNILNSLL